LGSGTVQRWPGSSRRKRFPAKKTTKEHIRATIGKGVKTPGKTKCRVGEEGKRTFLYQKNGEVLQIASNDERGS